MCISFHWRCVSFRFPARILSHVSFHAPTVPWWGVLLERFCAGGLQVGFLLKFCFDISLPLWHLFWSLMLCLFAQPPGLCLPGDSAHQLLNMARSFEGKGSNILVLSVQPQG